jgi:hypothetical protein
MSSTCVLARQGHKLLNTPCTLLIAMLVKHAEQLTAQRHDDLQWSTHVIYLQEVGPILILLLSEGLRAQTAHGTWCRSKSLVKDVQMNSNVLVVEIMQCTMRRACVCQLCTSTPPCDPVLHQFVINSHSTALMREVGGAPLLGLHLLPPGAGATQPSTERSLCTYVCSTHHHLQQSCTYVCHPYASPSALPHPHLCTQCPCHRSAATT